MCYPSFACYLQWTSRDVESARWKIILLSSLERDPTHQIQPQAQMVTLPLSRKEQFEPEGGKSWKLDKLINQSHRRKENPLKKIHSRKTASSGTVGHLSEALGTWHVSAALRETAGTSDRETVGTSDFRPPPPPGLGTSTSADGDCTCQLL